ncbi:MAG: general stress protein [Candidatus Aegiribacteria sp. MLS_C]|nr:MAG: general stress protein [Candidatus Aegiribacteria sp. MLS_C]
MAKVAVIVDEMFEDSEYTVPVEAFRQAGHEVVNVGLERGREVKGKKDSTAVVIDSSVDDVRAEDFDALLIPGGYSPDKLRAHEGPVKFAREFMEKDKPVFMICHGGQLLVTADVLKGRRVTGWRSIKQDLRNAGASYEDSEVVEDGNLVSSRQPSDLPAFVEASLRRLD